MQNYWFVGMSPDKLLLQIFDLLVDNVCYIRQFQNDASKTQKSMIRVAGAFQIRVSNLVYV